MKTLFISDLHLHESRPQITQLFIDFLARKAHHADALYILGDLFEAWIGDDYKTSLGEQVINSLAQVTESGTDIFLMHGNRDFLLGQQFATAAGCQLLPELAIINLYGHRAVLMHGDTLCTEDIEYLKFRTQARNPAFQQMFLSKPINERLQIAQQIRTASHQHTSMTAETIMDVTSDEVIKTFTTHQVNLLIHGHTHRPGIQQLTLGEQHTVWRYVLSDWETYGNYLESHSDGNFRLINFATI